MSCKADSVLRQLFSWLPEIPDDSFPDSMAADKMCIRDSAGADSADKHGVQLDWLQVTTGKGVKSVASIGLDIAGQKFEAASSGNGPVDAAINALKKVITKEMNLKEFTIQAIDKGSDDVGKVHMQVEYDGHVYYGFGADTDIVTASVEAYIDCINKFKVR